MTYHYISLAINRLPRFRGIYEIELYKEDGTPLPPMTEDEKFFFFGRKKIKDYYVEDGVMHCKLEGVR